MRDYARQTALGLQHAWKAGFVHRDIKPSNLLVVDPDLADGRPRGNQSATPSGSKFGTIKILDMGLARTAEVVDTQASITRAGAMIGTPDFIAPEQALDASSVDIRADLYSLGGTMYFLLTGRVPFPGSSVIEKLLKHQHAELEPIERYRRDVPTDLLHIIRRLMSKSPADRFQNPSELIDALEKVASVSDETSATPTMVSLPSKHLSFLKRKHGCSRSRSIQEAILNNSLNATRRRSLRS